MQTDRLNIQQRTFPLDEQPDWLNDTRNTEFSGQRFKVHTKQSCAEYISNCTYFWGIQDVDSGDWIGTMASVVDEHNNTAELGILIHWEYTGNGYGLEAWTAACDFLLHKVGVRKIEAGTMATNKHMEKIFRKSGMSFEGEKKNHFLVNDHPVGLIYYGRFA
jgi:RimJ/RimL family protein N-acetyltransferase